MPRQLLRNVRHMGSAVAVLIAASGLSQALAEQTAAGAFAAYSKNTDITAIFKPDGTGNPSVGETLDGCTILDSSQFGGKTAAQWIAGLDELVTNGGFDADVTGWTLSAGEGASMTQESGRLRIQAGASRGRAYQSFTTVIGATYRVSVDKFIGTSSSLISGQVKIDKTAGTGAIASVSPNSSNASFVFVATATTTFITLQVEEANDYFEFDNVSVKHLPGSHTVLAGTGPTLRQTSGMYYTETNGADDALTMALPARRNLLTYTEDFSNGVWARSSATVSGGVITATGASTSDFRQDVTRSTNGETVTWTLDIRRVSGLGTYQLIIEEWNGSFLASSANTSFVLTDDFQRISISRTGTAAGTFWRCLLRRAGGGSAADGDQVEIRNPQLETGSTATEYQSIGSDWMDDMMVSIAFSTNDAQGMLVNGSGGAFLGCFQDGSGSGLNNSFGSPSIRIDGLPFSGTTRDDLHAAIADGGWHVVTFVGADLSGLTELVLGFYAASDAFNTAYAPVGLITAPNTAENIELAEADLAKAMEPVGYSLSS